MDHRLHKLGQYVRGWTAYFGISQYYRPVPELDDWIRRRIEHYVEQARALEPWALHHRYFTLTSPCAFNHALDSACCSAGVRAMCQ